MKERVSVNIDNDLLEWIKEQIGNGEFDSQSSAIRKCIMITRRVYENANPEEMLKFIHGKNL